MTPVRLRTLDTPLDDAGRYRGRPTIIGPSGAIQGPACTCDHRQPPSPPMTPHTRRFSTIDDLNRRAREFWARQYTPGVR